MAYSDRQLGYARTVVDVGRAMGVSERGITIGLATVLVETNLRNYANRAVPASLTVPYDAIGSDSKSVGLFQQQPQWWGRGDGVDLMDPATAARLFFEALQRLPYDDAGRSPGSFAQEVQRSSFPTRYDERFKDAEALYALSAGRSTAMTYFDVDWAARFDFGEWRDTRKLIGVGVHTTEGSDFPNPPSAEALANYQATSKTGSYNVVVDTAGTRLRCNTDDWSVWATGNKGNYILLHISFCAFAGWSRERWLSESEMLRAGATTVAYWLTKYGWPAAKVSAALLPGVLGHGDTRVWGGTDHTDPGDNFPWAEFIRMVQDAMAGTVVPDVKPAPVPNLIDAEAQIAAAWIGARQHEGERPCADGVGKYADFEGGSAYWHPHFTVIDDEHVAIAVPTLVYEVWERHRWEQGFLGYPVRRHTVVEQGDIQAFQGGIVYRKRGTDGAVIHGVIGDRWYREGAETGPLGWPLADEQDTADGGRSQQFERGSLHWHPSGAVELHNL